MQTDKLYINGEWVSPDSEKKIEVENPLTQEIIDTVPRANDKDVNKAIKAANEALENWQFTSSKERADLIQKVLDKMKEDKDTACKIITDELGSPPSLVEEIQVSGVLDSIQYYIDTAKEYEYEQERGTARVLKEPVGVVACATPWNYPLSQVTKKVIPAMLAGNTIVLKPSQHTPLTAYWLTEKIHEAGIPKGVFNLVTGRGSEVGDVMAESPDVQMFSFTGSTNGGRKAAEKALSNIKKIVLELGGKSPAVFLEGADIKNGIKLVLDDITSNAGQTCSTFSRLIVHQDKLDEIKNELKEQIDNYKTGSFDDPDVNVGPLLSKDQFDRVKGYIEEGVKEGAELFIGEIPEYTGDYIINPTVFTNVNNKMTIAQEEIFGPVLSVITYSDLDEAVEIANDTIYGLSGMVQGEEGEAIDVARRIKTGDIYINDGIGNSAAPFGGYKQSGLGRENGVEGFEAYMEEKSLMVGTEA